MKFRFGFSLFFDILPESKNVVQNIHFVQVDPQDAFKQIR